MTEEKWKKIVKFPSYEVSSKGRVKSCFYRGVRRKKPIIRRLGTDKYGYQVVSLYDGTKYHSKTVHGLVLSTFVCPRPEGLECSHKNGVKFNNNLENLKWDTHKNNIKDRGIHGNHTGPRGERCATSILKEGDVFEIYELCNQGKSQREIAEKYSISQSCVSRIITGKNWAHIYSRKNNH